MIRFIGVDPGKAGGIAMLSETGVVNVLKLQDATERDIADWFMAYTIGVKNATCALLERVASSPQMGVCSAFTFGRGYGFLRGCLIGANIPFREVSPQAWQKAMGCRSKGDKNVTKQAAQQLYPDMKITHANADCLLIGTYLRQHHSELF